MSQKGTTDGPVIKRTKVGRGSRNQEILRKQKISRTKTNTRVASDGPRDARLKLTLIQ